MKEGARTGEGAGRVGTMFFFSSFFSFLFPLNAKTFNKLINNANKTINAKVQLGQRPRTVGCSRLMAPPDVSMMGIDNLRRVVDMISNTYGRSMMCQSCGATSAQNSAAAPKTKRSERFLEDHHSTF